jgi:hypothetical protein
VQPLRPLRRPRSGHGRQGPEGRCPRLSPARASSRTGNTMPGRCPHAWPAAQWQPVQRQSVQWQATRTRLDSGA